MTLGGTRIDRLAPHRIFRLGLARTFQKETTFAELTVEQNVRLGAVYGAGLRGPASSLTASTQRSQVLIL